MDLGAVIVACWHLDDHDRRTALEREGEQLRGAFLINAAMWDGQRLTREWERYAERLAESPHAPRDNAAIIDAARALLQPS